MIRVTTNSSLFNYRSNLMQVTNNLNKAMTTVMTGRNFDSYAADPAAATRAFKIHSSLNATQAQYDNNKTVTSKFETAWSTMEGILDDLTTKLGSVPALEGLNGTNLDDLDTQAQVLRAGAEAIIQSMNGKYGQDYIFAGSDNQKAPFAIKDGHVTYRGIVVDDEASLKEIYHDPDTNDTMIGADGKEMTNAQVLEKWATDDPLYVDIGLGFELDGNGKVVDSTAFDSSISGISILGYGVDEDGDPKNLASLMLRLADTFDSYKEGEKDPWGGNSDVAARLVNKFSAAKENMINAHSDLDAQVTFLNNNESQLESTFYSLNTERGSLEDADAVEAIEALVWAQTCYSAALQVGANVIPQSLMDYLK